VPIAFGVTRTITRARGSQNHCLGALARVAEARGGGSASSEVRRLDSRKPQDDNNFFRRNRYKSTANKTPASGPADYLRPKKDLSIPI